MTDQIVSLMTVPLVQGSLRYAYKMGEVVAERTAKNAAEGSTFSAAVLPLVAACDAAAAETRNRDAAEASRARAHFEASLAAERQHSVLTPTELRALVGGAGAAFAAAGMHAEAAEAFALGAEREPTFALYHYNLACAHAELGARGEMLRSLSAALSSLEAAGRDEGGAATAACAGRGEKMAVFYP